MKGKAIDVEREEPSDDFPDVPDPAAQAYQAPSREPGEDDV